MKISVINACPASFSYKGEYNIKVPKIDTNEQNLVQKAEAELQKISEQKKVAGTDFAWWRNEYNDAIDALKQFIKGDSHTPDPDSRVQMFHSDEDGFI